MATTPTAIYLALEKTIAGLTPRGKPHAGGHGKYRRLPGAWDFENLAVTAWDRSFSLSGLEQVSLESFGDGIGHECRTQLILRVGHIKTDKNTETRDRTAEDLTQLIQALSMVSNKPSGVWLIWKKSGPKNVINAEDRSLEEIVFDLTYNLAAI